MMPAGIDIASYQGRIYGGDIAVLSKKLNMPSHIVTALRSGDYAFRKRRWRKAEEKYQLVCEEASARGLEEVLPYCLNGMGAAAATRGEMAQALALFKKAIELKPDLPRSWYNLGTLYGQLDMPKEALECLDKAVALEPNNSWAWGNRGNALADLRRHKEALECYDRAIELTPNDSGAWVQRGRVLGELGRYEESIESLDKAIALSPMDVEAWHNRAVSLIHLGQLKGRSQLFEEALRSLERAMSLTPNSPRTLNVLGAALEELGRYHEAVEAFDKALKIKPDYAYAWAGRGNVLARLSKYTEAVRSYDRAISIEPDYEEAWLDRGEALGQMGQYEDAAKSLARAFERRDKLDRRQRLGLYQEYARVLLVVAHRSLSQQDEDAAWEAMANLRRIQIQAKIEGRARAVKAGIAEASAALAAAHPEKLRVLLGMLQDPWVGWTAASYIISEHWPRGLSVVDAVRAARE